MSLGAVVGLILIMAVVIIGITYLIMQANKRRKTHQKAAAAANRAAWEKWRNK